MLTPSFIWISLGIIFILFIISCAIIIINAKTKPSLNHSIYSKYSSAKTNFWKVVKGQIKQATIDYRDHKPLLSSTVKQYRTRITYEYFAYDKSYQHTVALSDWSNDKNIAKKYLLKHPEGGTIVVRFHPKSPETSIIELNS